MWAYNKKNLAGCLQKLVLFNIGQFCAIGFF